ncbi:MAG: ATP-binding cassette domain-containing protein [Polyangiaceae bacterium]|nr:ATP-binding cassette domain-containing protein [Polyangiaceae bacterium]
MLDITLDDIKPSSRKYPYIIWKTERQLGREVLFVDGISKSIDGRLLFRDVRLNLGRGEKMAITGDDVAVTAFMQILAGELEPDEGKVQWGSSVNLGVLPKDNAPLFDTDVNLVSWMRQFSTNQEENFVRGFLGRMLFSGEESQKSARVLSGGEKVRCMLARAMLRDPNVLLLDGPTNHLDLESITALNNSLTTFEGSVLVASHDVQFVDSLVTRVLELHPDTYYDIGTTYEAYLADEARIARVGKRAA